MTEVVFVKPDDDIVEQVPVAVLGWRLLIKPYRPPRHSPGGIEYVEESLDNTEILTNIGQVKAIGSQAFTAKTRSGIDMADIEPRPKVGDWVMFGTYGGTKIEMKSGATYRIINDDAILAIANDPNEFRIYL